MPDAEYNAELIGTNFKSQKWKTKKLVCPFLIAHFHFETNLIKGFCSFLDHFGQLGNFFQVGLKHFSSSGKKFFLLSNLFPRVPSFYIQTKSRLKSHVQCIYYNATVLKYYNTSITMSYDESKFLHSPMLLREKSVQIKNIHLGKPPLI